MNFKDYEWQRMKLTGSQTRLAIERAVDDVFVSRPRWKGALRVWGEDLLGPTTFGKADTNRWKFTSLRARASVSTFSFDDESKAFPEGELQSEKVTRPREKRDRSGLNSWHPEMESRGMNSLRK